LNIDAQHCVLGCSSNKRCRVFSLFVIWPIRYIGVVLMVRDSKCSPYTITRLSMLIILAAYKFIILKYKKCFTLFGWL
jgi:hypothetical protein